MGQPLMEQGESVPVPTSAGEEDKLEEPTTNDPPLRWNPPPQPSTNIDPTATEASSSRQPVQEPTDRMRSRSPLRLGSEDRRSVALVIDEEILFMEQHYEELLTAKNSNISAPKRGAKEVSMKKMDKDEVREFEAAMDEEVKSWLKYGAVRPKKRLDVKNLMRSRWILTRKANALPGW